ncbi:MAG: LON peptidase substrate-binding domain-containing protein, partial [Acidobacteria bacterium]|nr:LON peptidase substrate-binding domain-containing protein [Acidobacteriota bacterium]
VRTLNDDRAPVPDLPEDDPERLSFLIAAAMEMDNEAKQSMLELRSTAERLDRLGRLLAGVVEGYEQRARAHGLARGNGHGGGRVKLDE